MRCKMLRFFERGNGLIHAANNNNLIINRRVAHTRTHDDDSTLAVLGEMGVKPQPAIQGSFYAVDQPSKADPRRRKTRASEAQLLRGGKACGSTGPQASGAVHKIATCIASWCH